MGTVGDVFSLLGIEYVSPILSITSITPKINFVINKGADYFSDVNAFYLLSTTGFEGTSLSMDSGLVNGGTCGVAIHNFGNTATSG